VFDNLPVWVVALLIAALISAACEIGFRLGVRKEARAFRPPDELVLAAAFTLVALLLGFTFSMGLGRFDARRAIVVREANAIETMALRTDLLEAKTASAMRDDLRRYVDARLAVAEADGDARRREAASTRSDEMQKDMWRLVVESPRREQHPVTITLVVQALNDAIDASREERAIHAAYVPESVVVMLVVIASIATILLGFRFGRLGQREPVASAMLALMLALAIGIVLDLGAPQRGIIRVDLDPLRAVQRSIQP
jgi:hypothetical protein